MEICSICLNGLQDGTLSQIWVTWECAVTQSSTFECVLIGHDKHHLHHHRLQHQSVKCLPPERQVSSQPNSSTYVSCRGLSGCILTNFKRVCCCFILTFSHLLILYQITFSVHHTHHIFPQNLIKLI